MKAGLAVSLGVNRAPALRRPAALPLALAALVAITALGLLAQSAGAAKPLKAPRPGPWKIVAATNTPDGPEINGGVIGSFRVTKHQTIVGFHLSFTEGGETLLCAGGEEGNVKSGAIRFAPGASAAIVHANGEWLVAVDTGSLGGGSLQGAEVGLVTSPHDNSTSGLIYLTLASRKEKRIGNIDWDEQHCNVAFVVKPG
jgi:hypothetical protein